MSTKSHKRRLRRHRTHFAPTEAVTQKVIRLQHRLHDAIQKNDRPVARAVFKALVRAESAAGPNPTPEELRREKQATARLERQFRERIPARSLGRSVKSRKRRAPR